MEERAYPWAYTYRDWVIRSLNADLPYDQFLMQQIAADRLTSGSDKSSLAAMGFLTLGRRFLDASRTSLTTGLTSSAGARWL